MKQKVSELNIPFGIDSQHCFVPNDCYMHPDKVTRAKFILLDTKLDIRDEISYFIDDLVSPTISSTNIVLFMEEHIALSHIFKLSTELAKDPALFYHLGYYLATEEKN